MPEQDSEFQQLLKEIQEGSEESTRKFLDRFKGHILRVIRRRLDPKLRSKFDSEDFLQDVWATFFVNPPEPKRFGSVEELFAYLTKLARNKVAEKARQRFRRGKYNVNRERSLSGSAALAAHRVAGPEPTPSEVVVAEEQYTGLRAAQAPAQRDIITLLREGRTHEEIAQLLNVHPKNVQRVVRGLRRRLRS